MSGEKKMPSTGDYADMRFGDLTVRFCGFYDAGDPGVHTFSNGDPGYPGTPSSFEWETAWLLGDKPGDEIEVTDLVTALLGHDDDSLHEAILVEYETSSDRDDCDDEGGDDAPL